MLGKHQAGMEPPGKANVVDAARDVGDSCPTVRAGQQADRRLEVSALHWLPSVLQSLLPRPPLIALLCATMFGSTFSIGAFPALLPELAASGLADWQLGIVAGTFGFARMVADVPVGFLIAHHLKRALLISPLLLLAGMLTLTLGGDSLTSLLLGRAIMGVAHALGMVAGLTAILRYQTSAVASALNAFEFSAVLGLLGGTVVMGTLPSWLPWNLAYLVSCAPQLLGVVLIPAVLETLPLVTDARRLVARQQAPPDAAVRPSTGVALAFVAGAAIAITYATLEQFVIPLRGSREFGLDRRGVAHLLLTAQVCDLACLLPVGFLADRLGGRRVLSVVMLVFGVATALIAFGSFALVTVGCVLFGIGMSGWTMPLGLLRGGTPPGQLGWRTALYRVGVDSGMFLGPFLSGLLAAHWSGLLPGLLVATLAGLGVILLQDRAARRLP